MTAVGTSSRGVRSPVLLLLAIAWLAGCGYKGPLYLPAPKPAAKAPGTLVTPEPPPGRPAPAEAVPPPK